MVYAYQASLFRAIGEENISSRFSRDFVPKDQIKPFAHDKNRKRAEPWEKIYLFKILMYALVSEHEKLDV